MFALAIAGRVLLNALDTGFGVGHLAIMLGLVALALGLVAQHRSALRLGGALCLLLSLVVPLGMFNPFAASDLLGLTSGPQYVHDALVWLLPLELLFLGLAYFLDSPSCSDRH